LGGQGSVGTAKTFLNRWLARQKDTADLADGRGHARVVPRNPMATILMGDRSTTSCLVIDFSESGAAVSAPLASPLIETIARDHLYSIVLDDRR